jgi:hypothetical protein
MFIHKKSLVSLLCIMSINSIHAMSQQEKNNQLIRAAQSLYPDGIASSLCEGADKKARDKNGKEVYDIIYNATDSEGLRILTLSVDGTNLVHDCVQVLNDYPYNIITYFQHIGTLSPEAFKVPQETITRSLGTINNIDYHHDTTLHRAIKCGENGDAIARHLIGKRRWFNSPVEGINKQNDDGDTPLHLVMKTQRSDTSKRRMCLLLVSRGADAGILNNKGDSPFSLHIPFWIKLLSSSKQNPSILACWKKKLLGAMETFIY